MLSKAAFNAFLKILEEPPTSVMFILATTDPQKIIETVKSRCFQLFFSYIDDSILEKHLEYICIKENIEHDISGLKLIARASEGSARDSINLLERIRLSSSSVNELSVISSLGFVDDKTIALILKTVLTQDILTLLNIIKETKLETHSLQLFYKRFIDFIRACLWQKNGIILPDIRILPML